jgi:hypothetical protein
MLQRNRKPQRLQRRRLATLWFASWQLLQRIMALSSEEEVDLIQLLYLAQVYFDFSRRAKALFDNLP